ncbi:hypothetical protein [Janthinobacterium agaricidamnosum]|uniref:Uncharacterized protein n=1 Tax=Janthinobacterium agaricidamnosum NBRC 102515 = DSM 9628 TaxID=1349767 RepID=W0VD93_9BURK|nr:hypothetical protein [Janthinobacterium agaricidamnosum]CDG85348.1 hypothetical protein GJA_4744 [Janthinobacterium agaricidamnosum NBRC 102515 = DSM 9628]
MPYSFVHLTAWLRCSGVLIFAGLCTPLHAQQAGIPTVTVQSTRDPVDKSYRKMVKGMDRFERDHAYAPNASLRFRLLPRQPGIDMHGIALKIVGDTLSVPVPLAPDNSFAPPRNAQALREDAALVANRKATSMSWRAQVVTPGLPPDTRRLGDLRLECRAGMDSGLISNDPEIIAWLANMFYDTDKICSTPDGNYLFFTDRPLFGVTLHDGERRAALPFKLLYAGGEQTPASLVYCDCQVMLDKTYYAPLWDKSWPDDTLLEFEYMDDAPAEPEAQ